LIYEIIHNEFQLSAAEKKLSLLLQYDYCDADGVASSTTATTRTNNPQELPFTMSKLIVVGDDMKIVQVFRNIISNAIKFSPVGSNIYICASWVGTGSDHDDTREKSTSFTPKRQQLRRRLGRQQQEQGRRYTDEYRQFHRSQTVTLSKTKQDIVVTPKGCMKLTIRDEGPGLTKPQIEHIFEENTQFNVNELQGGQGSGLGLYIAKGIVNHHEGNIHVSSKGLGHGTTFTITLPLYEQQEQQQLLQVAEKLDGDISVVHKDQHSDRMITTETTSMFDLTSVSVDEELGAIPTTTAYPSASPQQGRQQQRSLNILIVDDSITNRKLLSRVLTNHGHNCDQASNGLEAYEMTSSCKYDCILMDYEMPVMDGPTAVSKIRHTFQEAVLIVGITGNMLPEDVQHFTSCGADCVLSKPVRFDDLYSFWTSMNLI
jgi:CheY-like chemotaxis protein